MKKKISCTMMVMLIFTSLSIAQQKSQPLFDGKTLTGWHMIPGGSWAVEDGVIKGTNPESDERHGLLVTDKIYKDFELNVTFKTLKGNSGLYFRVDETGGIEGVNGIQAEIHPEEYIGGLYETGGRGWISRPEQEDVKKWMKPGEWNTMTVKAVKGNIVVHVNGIKTAELKNDPGRSKGHIALQLHGGQEMLVYFKDIVIQEL